MVHDFLAKLERNLKDARRDVKMDKFFIALWVTLGFFALVATSWIFLWDAAMLTLNIWTLRNNQGMVEFYEDMIDSLYEDYPHYLGPRPQEASA